MYMFNLFQRIREEQTRNQYNHFSDKSIQVCLQKTDQIQTLQLAIVEFPEKTLIRFPTLRS